MPSIFLSELISTFLLILLGNGVVSTVLLTRSKGYQSGWIVITFGWGFAVCFAVYVGYWISGAHINPAVTLGLASIGKVAWALVPTYLMGQMLGAFLGAIVVYLIYYQHFKITEDPSLKLLCFCTAPAIRSSLWNFITEVIATFILLFGLLAILNSHNEMTYFFVPFIIGMLIFSIGLSCGGPTGFAINPARDLGPRIAHQLLPIDQKGSSDWSYAWIPILGPIVGGILGAKTYSLIFG
jgi:glycerol uptake facilitator protein